MRGWGWVRLAAIAAALLCVGARADIAASDDARASRPRVPTSEVSGGIDVATHSWSAYSTFTSTFGSSIRADGWRYRTTGGYGEYSYSSSRWTGASVVVVPFDGTVTFADVLLGYQQTLGPLTVKLFAGLAIADHVIKPVDIENSVQGFSWGAKGALETWLNIGDRTFGQLDLAYATVNQSYYGRLRLGYKFAPEFSAGLEGGFAGGEDYTSGRVGGFVRYEAPFGELSVSAGAAGDRSNASGAYGTVNILFRF